MDPPAPAPAGRGSASTANGHSTGHPAGHSTSHSVSSHSHSHHQTLSYSDSITQAVNIPERSPSRSSSIRSSHRQSFVENLRNPPPSPRSLRHPSLIQQALQDLVNHPPPQRQADPRFVGRDWRDIALGEMIQEHDIKWADMDTTVEECTKILLKSNQAGAVLLRNSPADKTVVATFDHSDLNAYLLVVIGLAKPEPDDVSVYRSIAERAHSRVGIPVRDIQPICHKDPIATLPASQRLPGAIELFGSGVHRILVTDPASSEVIGILSQLRLLEFFWNERVNFPSIDRLYPVLLRDLRIGSQETISINADRPLADALTLMNNEGLTSVAVVDNGQNVVGNISTTDVEHLTSVTSFPLLHSSCMHFISVILTERGVEEGRDSFPVFYVNSHSTLAHTVAKLVATRSHRMWVVDVASPLPSAPQTPLLAPVATTGGSVSTVSLVSPPTGRSRSASISAAGSTISVSSTAPGDHPESSTTATAAPTAANGVKYSSVSGGPPPRDASIASDVSTTTTATTSTSSATATANTTGNTHSYGSVPAAAMPGAHLSGRLTAVVSLTDILNLFAKTTGLKPTDPADARARRRRSSSSSVRPSLDGLRPSFDGSRSSLDLRR